MKPMLLVILKQCNPTVMYFVFSFFLHLQLLDELPMIYSTCVFVYCL